jgi:hypothetical protein
LPSIVTLRYDRKWPKSLLFNGAGFLLACALFTSFYFIKPHNDDILMEAIAPALICGGFGLWSYLR